VSVRYRERSGPLLATVILAAALASPFLVLTLASTVTTIGRAVAVALSLPALAVSALVCASVFLARQTEESPLRERARRVKTGSRTILIAYVVVVVPLLLFGIAAQKGQA
jgi:peptidoglycan/LPS O-acetylase OafA/YrhL